MRREAAGPRSGTEIGRDVGRKWVLEARIWTEPGASCPMLREEAASRAPEAPLPARMSNDHSSGLWANDARLLEPPRIAGSSPPRRTYLNLLQSMLLLTPRAHTCAHASPARRRDQWPQRRRPHWRRGWTRSRRACVGGVTAGRGAMAAARTWRQRGAPAVVVPPGRRQNIV